MRHTVPLPALFAVLAASTMACSADSGDTAPTAPLARSIPGSIALLAAIDDANQRLLPTVEADTRPAVSAALMQLRAGLIASEADQARTALDALTSAIANGDRRSEGTDANLSALAVLATATEQALAEVRR